MKWTLGWATHPGNVRSVNEDCANLWLYGDDEHPIVIGFVADGMGGSGNGGLAGECIAQFLGEWCDEQIFDFAEMDEEERKRALSGLFEHLNRMLLDRQDMQDCQLGSTLSLVICVDGTYAAANCGDTRIYRHCPVESAFGQISRDHSIVGELVRQGALSEEEGRGHPRRHVLTSCIGIHEQVDVHIQQGSLKEGDRLIIASDGLYTSFSPEEFRLLMSSRETVQPEKVLEEALRRGTSDNATLVIMQFGQRAERG
jgi:protein phosphatase